MKAFFRTALLSLLLAGAATGATAQRNAPVSRTPVADAATARARLFTLPAGDSNFFFRADLPGDNFLLIRFNRLRYWQPGTLPDIVAAAQTAWMQVRDSFRSATTARKLAVHLPPSGYPAVAVFREWGADESTVLLKGSRVQPLRIATDTLTVLKTVATTGRDTARGPQLEYTFLLKDLSDVEDLAAATPLLENLSRAFDSLAAAMARHWKHPDAGYHGLEAQYDLRGGTGSAATLRATTRNSLSDRFDYNVELGAGVLSGVLVTGINYRLSYDYHTSPDRSRRQYAALSLSALSLVSTDANNALLLRNLAFLNAEAGGIFGDASGSAVPLYRTSAGVGYRIGSQNPGPYDLKFRVFFNYSISKALTITPEFYSTPKRDDQDGRGIYGISVLVKLL